MNEQEIQFGVTGKRSSGDGWKKKVSGILLRPEDAKCLYVIGHGAGAGMRHHFMQEICELLDARGIATFRYQFPYMEQGRKRPDHHSVLTSTVAGAVVAGFGLAPDLPLVVGGKSMGGRMASRSAALRELPNVKGLVFLGFPLHPGGKPGIERGTHLKDVRPPMLFVQGTSDKFADPDLRAGVFFGLNDSTIHSIEGADHSFNVLKRSGRTDGEVLDEIAEVVVRWIGEVVLGVSG
jgi:predicted alpha/beta-hydrolase family hydrolase